MRVGWALSAMLLTLVSGCQAAAPTLRGHLPILVSSPANDALSKGLEQENQQTARFLLREFNKLHPEVAVRLSVVREGELAPLLARRQAMGLAPDLVLSSGSAAISLAAQHLSEPIALPQQLNSSTRWPRAGCSAQMVASRACR